MARQLPWLRILAEGTAIVVSILLAFGIQAWWEGRQERQQEADYLVRLVADLHADTAELANVVRSWTANEESARVLLAHLQSGRPANEDAATLLARAVLATHDRSPYMESATYEELRSSGRLRLIRDAERRDAVVGYHRALDSGMGFMSGMDRDFERYVLSSVDQEFQERVARDCRKGDGTYNQCSPNVAGFDPSRTLNAMASDSAFLPLANLRLSELALARGLLQRRLAAAVQALQILEGVGQ